jgi:hypothetical protein
MHSAAPRSPAPTKRFCSVFALQTVLHQGSIQASLRHLCAISATNLPDSFNL